MHKNMIIFGTRPEAIKLSPVVRALAQYKDMHTEILVTAQHRQMLDQVLAISGILPDYDLDLMRPGQSLDDLAGSLLGAIGAVLDKAKPDRVIVQGDTSTAMIGALAAYHRKIPVSHVEAGLRSHDIYQPWPEEVNRKIIGSIADQHFAPTDMAAAALLAEAVPGERIWVTGNTVIDALHWVRECICRQPSLISDMAELEDRFCGRWIIGITAHRRENIGAGITNIAAAIRKLAARNDIACIFPMHMNPSVRTVMETALGDVANVAMIEPLDYPNFVRLLETCHIMLTDSGGVQEEAPAFGKPVLVLRDTTERLEGVMAGTARLVGTAPDRIVAEVSALLDDEAAYAAMAQAHNPFGDGRAAGRIAQVIWRARWQTS